MQVTPNFMEKFYPILLQKASIVISSCIPLPPLSIRELAHDVVVDFFLSGSLKNTYDPKKGKIEPYFGSYAYRKMQRVRENVGRELTRFAAGGFNLDIASDERSVEEKYEMKDYLILCSKWLKGKYYTYGKTGQKKIDLYHLFNLCIASWVNFGEMRFSWIRQQLKCSYGEIEKAIKTMKRLVSAEEERCGITFG